MFSCDKCQYKAVSNNALKIHHKNFHMDGKFTCNICGRQESRKQNLEQHKTIFHDEIKYNCKQCNRDYSSKGSLLREQKHFKQTQLGEPHSDIQVELD